MPALAARLLPLVNDGSLSVVCTQGEMASLREAKISLVVISSRSPLHQTLVENRIA